MSKGSPVVLILIVAIALGALAFLNGAFQGTDPKAEQPPAQQDKGAADKANEGGKPAPQAAAAGGEKLVELGDDTTLGNKSAAKEMVVGYSWTPAVQADPSKVYKIVEQAQKGMPNARIRVVNVDAHPDVKAGISIEGKVIAAPEADGSFNMAPEVIRGIQQMMGRGGPSGMSGPPQKPGPPGMSGPPPAPPGP